MESSRSQFRTPKNGLFIFHRDLRITDNVGLIDALNTCENVYTAFIFTPEQVTGQNKYKSKNCVQFMIESLVDLATELRKRGGKLICLYGNPTKMAKYLIQTLDIEAVFYNKDYSPYAIERDNALFDLCSDLGVYCLDYSDYYLYEPGSVVTGSGEPYKKYTPFYETVIRKPVESPTTLTQMTSKLAHLAKTTKSLDHTITLDHAMRVYVGTPNEELLVRGGRMNALVRFKHVLRSQSHYTKKRDFFVYETTYLSAYIKFGCLSIRELYSGIVKTYGRSSGIVREVIWREFFAHVLYGFPNVLAGSYQPKLKHIRWHTSQSDFQNWMNGTTGFPMIDACMRQMNTTGYMHNRGRMTVASFLIKTLLQDWRKGERYFAQTLVDYDPASNNGNWQGISGTGVDMKPYFRDMNPWIQSAKFDPDAEYIKRWVPELASVPPNQIHKWDIYWKENQKAGINYPRPMVDYAEQKEKMLKMYQEAFRR